MVPGILPEGKCSGDDSQSSRRRRAEVGEIFFFFVSKAHPVHIASSAIEIVVIFSG
jgi:hypothetical protein